MASWVDALGAWGLWSLDALFLFAASIGLAWLHRFETRGLWLPICFIVLMRMPGLIEGGGMTRTFCTSLLMLALVSVHAASAWRWFFFAFLCGLVTMLQQEEALAFLPWMAWAILRSPHRWKTLIQLSVGFFTPVLCVLAWLTALGIFADFWFAAWVFNVDYVLEGPDFFRRFWRVMQVLGSHGLIIPIGIGVFFICKQGKKSFPSLHAALGASILLQVAASMLSGRSDGHYFLPFAALSTYAMFQGLGTVFPMWSYRSLFVLAAFCIPVMKSTASFISTVRSPSNVYEKMILKPWEPVLGPLRSQRGQFYVVRKPEALALNTEFRIIAPTKWAFDYLWDKPRTSFDHEGREFDGVLRDIDIHQTRLILDYTGVRPWKRNDIQAKWNEFIVKNYRLDATTSDGGVLWRRKSPGSHPK